MPSHGGPPLVIASAHEVHGGLTQVPSQSALQHSPSDPKPLPSCLQGVEHEPFTHDPEQQSPLPEHVASAEPHQTPAGQTPPTAQFASSLHALPSGPQ